MVIHTRSLSSRESFPNPPITHVCRECTFLSFFQSSMHLLYIYLRTLFLLQYIILRRITPESIDIQIKYSG